MSTRVERLTSILPVVLAELRERQDALCVPLLGDDLTSILPVVLTPMWLTAEDGPEVLAMLAERGKVERVEEDVLGPLAGHGLPLRAYWPAGVAHGWRVVR